MQLQLCIWYFFFCHVHYTQQEYPKFYIDSHINLYVIHLLRCLHIEYVKDMKKYNLKGIHAFDHWLLILNLSQVSAQDDKWLSSRYIKHTPVNVPSWQFRVQLQLLSVTSKYLCIPGYYFVPTASKAHHSGLSYHHLTCKVLLSDLNGFWWTCECASTGK